MGAKESRRVTVDNADEDSIGVVRISESLLRGSNDHKPVEGIDQISQEDLKRLWEELLERKKVLDHQQENIDDLLQDAFEQGQNTGYGSLNFAGESLQKALDEKQRELEKIRENTRIREENQLKKYADAEAEVTKEFNNSVSEMEEKYSKKKAQPICNSLQHLVVDCYRENKSSSLKCSQLVRDYVKCVEEARQSMAKRQTTP